MQFSKTNNMYRIIRITGSQDNILGVCFSENNSSDSDIEVIEFNPINDEKIQTSGDQVLKQVLLGLKEVNQSLDTSYRLSKIYFLPSDSASGSVYQSLIKQLIRHYHNGNEFKEVKENMENISLKDLILLENYFYWQNRESYLELMKLFLKGKIGGKQFDSEFSKMRNRDSDKIDGVELNKIKAFSTQINGLFMGCKDFEADPALREYYEISEEELKNFVEKTLLKMQKYL